MNWHVDGLPWWKTRAPLPWHRHYAHTVGSVGSSGVVAFRQVQRCACGAIREGDWDYWTLLDKPRRRWLP
jgi:hypothetical protein